MLKFFCDKIDQCIATYCQEIVHFIGNLLESITDSIQPSHITIIESGLASDLLDALHVFTSREEVTKVRFNYLLPVCDQILENLRTIYTQETNKIISSISLSLKQDFR